MPILRGAATFSRYRVGTEDRPPSNWTRTLSRTLRARAFEPLKPDAPEERATGFVELEDRERWDFGPGSVHTDDWAHFSFRVDEVQIPNAVVKDMLERWAKQFELEHQRKPGRKEKQEAKLEARRQLRPRFPLSIKTHDVSWNLKTAQLFVWAASRKAVDEVTAAVEQAFKVKLVPLVPAVMALDLKIPEKALTPTPLLSLLEAPRG